MALSYSTRRRKQAERERQHMKQHEGPDEKETAGFPAWASVNYKEARGTHVISNRCEVSGAAPQILDAPTFERYPPR